MTPKHDSQRETRVLLEELGGNVRKIAEQVSSNSEKLMKLDTIESNVNEIKSELGTVKMVARENSSKIDGLTDRVGSLEKGQEEIKQKLDTVTTNHEERLQKLETVR